MVNVNIDGTDVMVDEGTTILDAAKQAGMRIPTLCFLKDINEIASCRMCVVEVEGSDRLSASCNTEVVDGMVVKTHSKRVQDSRRHTLSLILADHRTECTSCIRTGTCELQQLSFELGMKDDYILNKTYVKNVIWDNEFPLQRDSSKCIKCMRCVATCRDVQACDVWDVIGTGPQTKVGVVQGNPISTADCTACGQCIINCPVGALTARDDIDLVVDAINNPEITTVVNVAPAVRSSWGEALGLTPEQATVGRMVAAMRHIGFDYLFDTDFAADLTIMEEGSELLARFGDAESKDWPMFTSCCPGWVRYAKQRHQELLPQLSSAKSPHQMLGALAKSYFAQKAGIDPEKLFVVSLMPCVAKKYESSVPEVNSAGAGRDIDAVLTIREFDRLINRARVDAANLEEDKFDDPLGISTGAGTIFGVTGGVMEAALRSAEFLITGANPEPINKYDLRDATDMGAWREKTATMGDAEVRYAVVSGLSNTEQLLEALESGEVKYDFVEVMACPGGCVNGGGHPHSTEKPEAVAQRHTFLRSLDHADTLRCSHDNPAIGQLYEEFLEEPLGHTAHHYLHTDQEAWQI